MEVKSFTYKNLLGTYYLQGWLSSQKMDDHIATMLKDGWQILTTADQSGDGARLGLGEACHDDHHVQERLTTSAYALPSLVVLHMGVVKAPVCNVGYF